MKTPRIPGLAVALVLTAVACKQRNETTAPPAPTPVVTAAPPAQPAPPQPTMPMPGAVVDAGVVQPGPNAMLTPDAGATGIAPGAAPPTGAPPAAPMAPPTVAAADAGVAPAAPTTAAAAPTAPSTRPSTRTGTTTPINIPGVTGAPPVTVHQGNGQTRVNVGGVQVLIPGVGGN